MNRIQSGETILNPINKLVSMMFLKWVQSDQSAQSGSIIFFYKGLNLSRYELIRQPHKKMCRTEKAT